MPQQGARKGGGRGGAQSKRQSARWRTKRSRDAKQQARPSPSGLPRLLATPHAHCILRPGRSKARSQIAHRPPRSSRRSRPPRRCTGTLTGRQHAFATPQLAVSSRRRKLGQQREAAPDRAARTLLQHPLLFFARCWAACSAMAQPGAACAVRCGRRWLLRVPGASAWPGRRLIKASSLNQWPHSRTQLALTCHT